MAVRTRNQTKLLGEASAILVERLRGRQHEIEETISARALAVSASDGDTDAEYRTGLRAVVIAVVEYCLKGFEVGEEGLDSVPPAAIAQVRRAAQSDVSLGTVILRYLAGHRLLGQFVMEESRVSGVSHNDELMHYLRSVQDSLLEQLTAAVTAEYECERARVTRSAEQRRKDLVQRLLLGEPVQAEFDYEFNAWHLGIVAAGSGSARFAQKAANDLTGELLLIASGDGAVWAWISRQRKITPSSIKDLLRSSQGSGVSLAIGEPGQGIGGWRLTHSQAQEAMWVSVHSGKPVTRYAEVLLLSAALRNSISAKSLKDIFLGPLDDDRNGGQVLRQTMRALLETGYNVKAAASMLGVDRSTVRKRRRTVEERLGRPLHSCQSELDIAMRLEELETGAMQAARTGSD